MSLLNFFCTWNVDKKVPRDSGGRGGGFKGLRVKKEATQDDRSKEIRREEKRTITEKEGRKGIKNM